jgi:hypothetical protein
MWTRELLSPAPPDGRNLYGARAEQAISSDLSREVVRTIPTERTLAHVADVSDSAAVNEI